MKKNLHLDFNMIKYFEKVHTIKPVKIDASKLITKNINNIEFYGFIRSHTFNDPSTPNYSKKVSK